MQIVTLEKNLADLDNVLGLLYIGAQGVSKSYANQIMRAIDTKIRTEDSLPDEIQKLIGNLKIRLRNYKKKKY